jgi:hypothetical protein
MKLFINIFNETYFVSLEVQLFLGILVVLVYYITSFFYELDCIFQNLK